MPTRSSSPKKNLIIINESQHTEVFYNVIFMLMLQDLAYLLHSSTCLLNKRPRSLLLQKLPSSTSGAVSLWLQKGDSRSGTGESHFTARYLESLPRTIL